MKLIQVANRGSYRQVVLQFSTSELISIIAMFEVVLSGHKDGYHKEKTMRAKFENVLRRIEEVTRNNEDFYDPPTTEGRVFFDGEEEMEPTH